MSYIKINLSNVADNFKLLQAKIDSKTKCGAVVKADAYGLGAVQVCQILEKNGCHDFFVAHIDEALRLRQQISSDIYLLHGVFNAETAKLAHQHNITPVLNCNEQVALYNDYADTLSQKLPAILNFDTGMGRLGIAPKDAKYLQVEFIDCIYIMSHLACADEPDHPLNPIQLCNLKELIKLFPGVKMSLANSSGIFLSNNYHFDLVRPGCAIYGMNPTSNKKNPMKTVVTINAKIVQRRILDQDQYVGYGASHLVKAGSKIFIVEYGYSDGYFRSLSNNSKCYVDGFYLDIIGRVSMDLTICDATILPQHLFQQTEYVEMLGEHITLEELAKNAGTIGYEILTNVGSRYQRKYIV